MPNYTPVSPQDTWRMEQFGRSYVEAVAAVAACSVSRPSVDDDSVDLTFARRTTLGHIRSPKLDAQLKTTGSEEAMRVDDLVFPLSIKNYDDLRPVNLAVPRILIVVLVPPDIDEWILQDESQLLLRKCGYWFSLRGAPSVMNQSSKTVHIPKTQVFGPTSLSDIFERLSGGMFP